MTTNTINFPDGTSHSYTTRSKRQKTHAVIRFMNDEQAAAELARMNDETNELFEGGYRTADEHASSLAYNLRRIDDLRGWRVWSEHYAAAAAMKGIDAARTSGWDFAEIRVVEIESVA